MDTLAEVMARRPVVLDGGLATQLEAQGNDLSSALWSARLLADNPAEIVAAHRRFFAAGAEIAISASYQASVDGFATVGVDRRAAEQLLRRSVGLAREAAAGFDGPRWIAASVGPYGAALADGSEYRGDYGLSVAELRHWHRPRLAVLAAAEPDVLALETVPCLAEAEALLTEVADLGLPCWLSMTGVGDRTRAGEPVTEAYAMAAEVSAVIAVGANCVDPSAALGIVRLAAGSGKPVVIYPNSGETWAFAERDWRGRPTQLDPIAWVRAGARLVGGCCRVGPEQVRAIGSELLRAIGSELRSASDGVRGRSQELHSLW